MPREAFFPLPCTTRPPVSLLVMYKQGTDVILIELCVCPLALFCDLVDVLRPRLSRLGVPPDVRTAIGLRCVGGGNYIDIGAALRVHSATVYSALWDVIDAVNSSTRRRSHDSAPTTRSCCIELSGLGAAAPPSRY